MQSISHLPLNTSRKRSTSFLRRVATACTRNGRIRSSAPELHVGLKSVLLLSNSYNHRYFRGGSCDGDIIGQRIRHPSRLSHCYDCYYQYHHHHPPHPPHHPHHHHARLTGISCQNAKSSCVNNLRLRFPNPGLRRLGGVESSWR
eukprot:2716176-Rhodomonas_salina.1